MPCNDACLIIAESWNITPNRESAQVGYCENDVDCRRSLQLAHFGEKFDGSICKGTCDNCSKSTVAVEEDVSGTAKQLVCNRES